MGTNHTETERKYEGGPLPRGLGELRGVAATEPVEPQDLDAVYYDTVDLRLLRRRVTLRRRSGGTDPGWHLKLPLDGDSRQELRLPLDAAGGDGTPPDFAVRVKAFTRGAALVPVVHLRTRRTGVALKDEEGAVLAQVVEDRVTAQVLAAERLTAPGDEGGAARPGPATDGGSSTEVSGWTEVEVELEAGTPDLLDRVDAALADAGLVRSPWPAKLARALGPDRSRTAEPTALPTGTAGALVMAGFREHLARLPALDAAVRRAEEDSVHQLRITTRRLRSLLRGHRRLFDRDRADHLADELRWLGHLLGDARDQEVLGEQVLSGLGAVPAQGRRSALRTLRGLVTARYDRGYRRAWARAVSAMDGPRYFTLLADLEAFATDPPLHARADRDASDHLSDVLRQEQRRTVKRLDRALHTEPGPQRDEALHRARKAAKRARYTAEGGRRPSLPKRARKRTRTFGKRMKKLHKVLGAYQDSVVERRELSRLAGEDPTTAPHAFAYGVLHERERERADAAVRRLPELRSRAARRKPTRLS
ncbi:CYTH and CHAD domain-containing protein [Kitasatospora sp. A2-31]|uniref:CYTH and CHAD domain-containing protein n=1 Tax=Kitasatospora sp. A2-31 TaxID=2916414 RepID=UPI001EEA7918|nr:CYTH and CHAD domain-containing protein [Kitasatospora sp. A2-31]MCG6494288.1 CYTH and CHAD domain-containing protein [Kitasatospora sp. A2-31]